MVSEPVTRTLSAAEGRTTRQPLQWWVVPAVASVVLLVSAAALVLLWTWVDRLGLGTKELATAELDVVKVVSGIAVGGGGLFALYLAARRQRTQELELAQRETVHALAVRVAENTEKDAAERRVTDLYAKAVEQLGSDKAPVRLGGMYALRRLAQDDPRQRQTIVDVMCAYLRMPFTPPGEELGDQADPAEIEASRARNEERQVRLAAQRILGTHLAPERVGVPAGNYWPDVDIDLTGATLIDFEFAGCKLRTAAFDGARFLGAADFFGVTFAGDASFRDARFLGRTNFLLAQFLGNAFFIGATFHSFSEFQGTGFFGFTSFRKVQFDVEASFLQARFKCVDRLHSNRVEFGGVRFRGDVNYGWVRFDVDADFGSCTFGGRSDFTSSQFGAGARFSGAVFAEDFGFNSEIDRNGRGLPESPIWVRLDVSPSKYDLGHSWPEGWTVVPAEGRPDTNDTGSWGHLVEAGEDE
ncbi:pentapeptide repeat-containing protein [Amycolatopsis sp. NPDC051102]|uniref:pentapeptide repeat-containing protein n=1 Tax=Amycolatopsis sp. NPDC051102 TaxID=3155163 RepID=UPI00343021FB